MGQPLAPPASGFADMLQGNKELCRRLHQQAVASEQPSKPLVDELAILPVDDETGDALHHGRQIYDRYQKEVGDEEV